MYQFYKNLAKIYEHSANCKFYQQIAHLLCKHIPKNFSPKYTLEVGTGTGLSTQILREYFPKAEIIATEPCLEMLKLASIKNIAGVKYLALKAEDIPLLRKKFDLIFGNFCYHWFSENIAIKLKQCLSKKGLLAFSIPINRADGVWGNKLLVGIYRTLKKKHHLKEQRQISLKHILQEFVSFKVSYHLFSFVETYPPHIWINILRSRGSWHFLFGTFATEAEKLWQMYANNKKQIPLKWHIALLIGENDERC